MSGNNRADDQAHLSKARELLGAIKLKRARLLSDRVAVKNGDPGKHYAWINVHQERIQWFTGMGYQICRDPKIHTDHKKEDGTHRRADLILMECPKDTYDALKYAEELQGIEGMDSAENMFLEFADRFGIPVTQEVPNR